LFLPEAPYLLPFLKIRINSLHIRLAIAYKTLGITSQGALKKRLAHAAPGSGMPTKDGLQKRTGTDFDSEHYRCGEWTFSDHFFEGTAPAGACVPCCFATKSGYHNATRCHTIRYSDYEFRKPAKCAFSQWVRDQEPGGQTTIRVLSA
jgi:hypothetical protein